MRQISDDKDVCPSIMDAMALDSAISHMIKAIYGDDITDEEIAAHKARQIEKMRSRKHAAIRKACSQLRDAGRPICRRDMHVAIEQAIMQAVKQYEESDRPENAVHLLSLLLCRKMLDGEFPFEGDDD